MGLIAVVYILLRMWRRKVMINQSKPEAARCLQRKLLHLGLQLTRLDRNNTFWCGLRCRFVSTVNNQNMLYLFRKDIPHLHVTYELTLTKKLVTNSGVISYGRALGHVLP